MNGLLEAWYEPGFFVFQKKDLKFWFLLVYIILVGSLNNEPVQSIVKLLTIGKV
jgi:hypothetical protein